MIGAVVLATEQGLGYMAKDFYENGLINHVLIQEHTSRKNHYEWYKNPCRDFDELMSKVDTIVFFETPFEWKYIKLARSRGIKTVLIPMYECTNLPNPYIADIIITPSDLDQEYYPDGIRVNIPVPNEIQWKLRERARTFVHNAGNGGVGGRNGTKELLEAMRYVKSPIKLIIRSQEPEFKSNDSRIVIERGSISFDKLWNEGDMFIFPEKFNGLSLPIQEAFASGMAVMCGDRFPMNKWLPTEILIPVSGYKTEILSSKFQSAQYDSREIARCIDKWYDKDITKFSLLGKEFKEQNSWSKLKGRYEELMCA